MSDLPPAPKPPAQTICPECQAAGLDSHAFIDGAFVSVRLPFVYYDTAGIYHHHDSNLTTTAYFCTQGHKWRTQSVASCPNCDWPFMGTAAAGRIDELAKPPPTGGGEPIVTVEGVKPGVKPTTIGYRVLLWTKKDALASINVPTNSASSTRRLGADAGRRL